MSYVTSNLSKDETVLYSVKIHWIAYVISVLSALIGVILLLGHFSFGIVFLVLAAFWVFNIRSRELAVTNRRVIGKSGIVRRDSIELRHDKIETIRVDQTIFGRMFGYGTVTVRGTGSSMFGLKGISDPLKFRSEVDQAGDSQMAVDLKSVPTSAL